MRNKVLLFTLVIIALITATKFMFSRYEALDFHPRDYTFYMEFATKVFDGTLTEHYSVKPIGRNFLGFYGIDGYSGFHANIHFEPFKYVQAMIVRVTNMPASLCSWSSDYFSYCQADDGIGNQSHLVSPAGLFLATGFMYFAPAIYLIYVFIAHNRADHFFVALIVTIIIVYPASFVAISQNLRPIVLLPPVFLAFVASIVFERSFGESIAWFNLMFLFREEALVFGLLGLLIYLVTNLHNSDSWRRMRWFVACWCFWAIITGVYFLWSGFPNRYLPALGGAQDQPLVIPPDAESATVAFMLLILFLLCGLLAVVVYQTNRKERFPVFALAALLLAPVTFALVVLVFTHSNGLAYIAYSREMLPLVFITLAILLVLWVQSRLFLRLILLAVLSLIAVGSLWSTFGPAPSSPLTWYRSLLAIQRLHLDLTDIRAQLDPYTITVLTDVDTVQAFPDFERVLVFDHRFFSDLSTNDPSIYQKHRDEVIGALRDNINVVVFNNRNETRMLELIRDSGMQQQLVLWQQNQSIQIYRILRTEEDRRLMTGISPWVDFAGQIRVQSIDSQIRHRHDQGIQTSEMELDVRLVLQSMTQIEKDYDLRVRLIGWDGLVYAEGQGWPGNAAPRAWDAVALRTDHRRLQLTKPLRPGVYATEIAFIDPNTQEPLPAVAVVSGHSLSPFWFAGYVTIPISDSEDRQLSSAVQFADNIVLLDAITPLASPTSFGGKLLVRLKWQASAPVRGDYTVFVHLLDSEGSIIAQQDSPPLNGFYPTTAWQPGQAFEDEHYLELPLNLHPGAYTIHVGLYDPVTGQRLAVEDQSKLGQDYVTVPICCRIQPLAPK